MTKRVLLVSLLVLILMVRLLTLQPVFASADPSITEVTGTVEVQRAGTTEWIKVTTTPFSVNEGDEIRTGANSEAKVEFDSQRVKLRANSSIEIGKEDREWVIWIITGAFVIACVTTLALAPGPAKILTVICFIGGLYTWLFGSEPRISAFRGEVTVRTDIDQKTITGSLGLHADGTACATGQEVSLSYDDGTISEPIEVSLSPSEAMELYNFVYDTDDIDGFGGIWIPVDKFGLLAPYIGLTSTILVATVAIAIYVKFIKPRKEKQ